MIFLGQIGAGAFGVVQQATAYGIGRVPKASNVAVKMLRGTAVHCFDSGVFSLYPYVWKDLKSLS